MTAGLVAVLLGVAVWLAVPGHGSWARPGGVADGPVDRAGPKGRSPAADGRTQVTEAMDLMALALGTGLPLETALREVARTLGDPGAAELRSVAAALAWGMDDRAAWAVAGSHWGPAGEALALARRVGAPPAGLLRSAAEDERRRRARRAEERASALPVRLVVPLGLLFLPGFLLTTVLPVVVALAADLLGRG